MFKIRFLFLLVLIFACSLVVNATHNRAGEITFVQLSQNTFEFTVTTYTKVSGESGGADEPSLLINWGDNLEDSIYRVSEDFTLGNDIKKNVYVGQHTYQSTGATYTVSITSPFRVGNIQNINGGNTLEVPFSISTKVLLLDSDVIGFNSSPVLLQPPIDDGFINATFMHNPTAYDPDGDSIAYELIIPNQDRGEEVPNYQFPNEIQPGPNNMVTLDEVTGDFTWDAPQNQGYYNIAILIKEYRRGLLISCIVRDMQIDIGSGDFSPPTIEIIEDTCVIAGDTLNFKAFGDDMDTGQKVKLEANGGPLVLAESPATFVAPLLFAPTVVEGTFNWNTVCNHIQGNPYSVVFKATDDFDGGGLSTFKTLQITVVAPAPQIDTVIATALGNEVYWQDNYACDDIARFRGFDVYRKSGSSIIEQDTCNPSLASLGYTLVAESVTTTKDGKLFFLDDLAEKGMLYCYRIVAMFDDKSVGSTVESLASEEKCVLVGKDVPFITHVDVQTTDLVNGEIEVSWTIPDATVLDTTVFIGPYLFNLVRVTDAGAELVASKSFNMFGDINDTMFVHTSINTLEEQHTYQIEFVAGVDDVGTSQPATSVFLSAKGSNATVFLNWESSVPWTNFEYHVYKLNDATGFFDSIGVTSNSSFTDNDVINDTEYCYLIKALGSYMVADLPDTLINYSQEACATPVDTIAPCALTQTSAVTIASSCASVGDFNQISWDVSNSCIEQDATLNIYTSDANGQNQALLATITDVNSGSYTHQSTDVEDLLSCYYVTVLDSIGNEGEPSTIVCGQACPEYSLPNTFTPNGDGQNDLFVPFPYRFVERIELNIFNEWGVKVFSTTDPGINWDGTNLNGAEAAEGVYYYHGEVYLIKSADLVEQGEELKGFIHLLR